MSFRRTDPFNDFYRDRGIGSYPSPSPADQYYSLKLQIARQKLEEEERKKQLEESLQHEETRKMLEYYKNENEKLRKIQSENNSKTETSNIVEGAVDIRAPNPSNPDNIFLENARRLISEDTKRGTTQ